MKKELKEKISNSVVWLEAILAIFILASVFIGAVDLIKYLRIIIGLEPQAAYDEFKAFLGHLLLLVIGLEMIIMLVRHSPGSVIEVLVFAIARKLLIYAESMVEVLLGIFALAGLFAIRKYLFVHHLAEAVHILSGETLIKDVNNIAEVNIPINLGDTIGEVTAQVIEDNNKKIAINEVAKIGNARIKILKLQDKDIEKVKVERLTDKHWRE